MSTIKYITSSGKNSYPWNVIPPGSMELAVKHGRKVQAGASEPFDGILAGLEEIEAGVWSNQMLVKVQVAKRCLPFQRKTPCFWRAMHVPPSATS